MTPSIADNGTLTLWDYATGTPFQNFEDIPQPGSLEAEAGVFCSTFDQTGTRLITGGADKTIKVRFSVFSFPRSLQVCDTDISVLSRYMPNNLHSMYYMYFTFLIYSDCIAGQFTEY